MKFSIETNDLAEALTSAVGYAQKASLFTPFSMAYIEAKGEDIIIRTGNSNSNFECTLLGTVEIEGSVLVSAEKVEGILSKITSDSVTVERDGANLRVKPMTGKKTSVKLACRDTDIYAAPIVCPAELLKAVPGTLLADAISHVAFAAGKDAGRPAIMGIRMEQHFENEKPVLTLVATNGKFLAKEDIVLPSVIPGFTAATVPTAFALKLINILKGENISIGFDGGRIFVTNKIIKVNSECLASAYPSWQNVIPPSTWESLIIKAKGADLAETLGLTSVLVDGASRKTHFTFTKNSLTVMSATDQYGEAEQDVDVETNFDDTVPAFTLAFNEQLIQPVIATLKSSSVVMALRKNPDRPQDMLMGPLVITSELYPSLLYCIMPMQSTR